MSFGIDFSGSTNLVLLPSATASTTLGITSTTRSDVAAAAATKNEEGGEGHVGPVRNGEGGEKVETCDEVASVHGEDEAVTTVDKGHGATVDSGGASPLSARVSAEAFCRTVLARVAIRDPEAAGTIKVNAGKQTQ